MFLIFVSKRKNVERISGFWWEKGPDFLLENVLDSYFITHLIFFTSAFLDNPYEPVKKVSRFFFWSYAFCVYFVYNFLQFADKQSMSGRYYVMHSIPVSVATEKLTQNSTQHSNEDVPMQ